MSSKDLIEYIVSRILFLVESDGKSSQNESRYAWLCSKELKSKTDVTCHDMNRLSRILDKISINQQIDGLFRLENFYNEYGKLSFAVAVDTFEEIHISNIMIKKIGYQRAQNISSVGKNKGVLQNFRFRTFTNYVLSTSQESLNFISNLPQMLKLKRI